VRELLYLRDLGRSHIEIMDDTFTVNKRRLRESLAAIIDAQLDFTFKVRSRVDAIDDETIGLMRRAGVRYMVFGIESGSDRMLKAMNKRTTVAANAGAISLAKGAGMAVFADIFVGYPGETMESIDETLKFLLRTRPTGVNLASYYPLPCTVGWDTAQADGSLEGEWSHLHELEPFVKLDFIGNKRDLWLIAQGVKRRFYLDPLVFAQTARFLLKSVGLRDFPRIMRLALAHLLPRLKARGLKDAYGE